VKAGLVWDFLTNKSSPSAK